MTTLDDKILGEKRHYYCSSDEDDDSDRISGQRATNSRQSQSRAGNMQPGRTKSWDGFSVNTGPKGVIQDWRRFKQLESEKKQIQDDEKLSMMKKLSLTCKSHLDEVVEQQQEKQIDEEIEDLLNGSDGYLNEYMKKRMEEMIREVETDKKRKSIYGQLICLNSGAEFLEAVDKESRHVTVVCHIYSDHMKSCEVMNGCLKCLATEYQHVKFCCLEASSAGMSKHFEKSGVPALLVYKGGNLVGNFVRISDEFEDNFFAVDVEAFLIEHGLLPDQNLVPELIKRNQSNESI